MTYTRRLAFLSLLDSIIVMTSIYFVLLILRIDLRVFISPTILITMLTLLTFHHIYAFIFRLYHKAWEYASVGELTAIVKAVTLSIFSTAIVQLIVIHDIYFRVLILTWMMHILLIGGSRFCWRVFRDSYYKPKTQKKRTLIIGAGAAGTMVAKQLLLSTDSDLEPIGFIDDDSRKINLDYFGLPVFGNVREIYRIVETQKIELILIAIPSLTKKELNLIVDQCTKTKVRTQIMPKIEDLMTGKVSVTSFRDVEVEDLLGRDPIELDLESISAKLAGKTILVTGAGGSIGSEICRQVSQFKPKKLVLLGHGENSIYQINMELQNQYKHAFEIVPVIADVQDKNRIFEVMEEHQPNVVYHAAAHKHVPMMEYNPKEAVKNNIFGTKNVAEAAGTFGVDTFVLISTDKAVNPTNVMGATKRCAELIIQEMDREYNTKYVAVRFGNVLGSRGSVIPLFKKQIQEGGPITVTHPDITRYFMTIPEASRLVIQAGSLARGGEIFVLDMGEPVKIVDLAKNLIRLSGYTEDEIGIVYSGLRPGEKMYEELLNENEIYPEQVFPKIHIGKAKLVGQEKLHWLMENFGNLDVSEIRATLLEIANIKQQDGMPVIQTVAH
ncbi:nucleoside-diphosphate sugar epimerase/dehydratase [Caldibacillus thermoamylovorans]|uniref:polysaccharide biosynthesis protein n=1 Tax=Caldibacillus thermoamylovorans TaxID=35841 RepID=UPI00203B13AE|nr:nucleoside-diphosphate sugar epimerase/dehydratase [Caldibacillus thermoamylovorans]MCM3054287.1 polysaccharide biosynthesis protein [Caldibacillus thermoamylovorans]